MSDTEKGTTPVTPTFAKPIPQFRTFANGAPLGLFSFASTTFMLSMYNVNTRGIHVPNVVVGMALGVGGLCQLLAGMWEFAQGNVFGATAFSSYGGFWLSYAAIFLPGSGIITAYGSNATELNNAVGIFLATWFIVTFFFLITATRISLGLVALFFFLEITFVLLFAGAFTGKVAVTNAGGGFGILTALIAYYNGFAGLVSKENGLFNVPVVHLHKRSD